MIPKLKNLDYKQYLQGLRDVRVVGLWVFTGVVILVTWSVIGVIQSNYELQKKIAGLEQEVSLRELENSNAQLKNEYYLTDQYLELQARRQFGRAAPGEQLLIVPRAVAQSHSVEPLPKEAEAQTAETVAKPQYQQNFEAWMEFLFRRHPVTN